MIKAEVKYTPEHFKAIKIDPLSLKQKIIWTIIAILSICLAVLYTADGHYFNFFTLLSAVLWFFIILYVLYYHVIWSPKGIMKKFNKLQPDTTIFIEFSDCTIRFNYSSSDSAKGYTECSYDDIEAVWEKNGFFVLNVLNGEKTELDPIKYSEITEGTPEELRQLLKDKLGERFTKK